MVKTFPTRYVEWHPTSQEKQCSHTRHNKQIQILSQVEKSEMNTRIFCVVSGCQLALGFGQVERTTIGLGRTGNQINQKCDYRRDMTCKQEPTVSLSFYYTGYRHCSGKDDHRQYRQPDRKFVTHHLSTASNSTDKCKFIVTGPTGQQNTQHSYGRNGDQEEHADIKIDNL